MPLAAMASFLGSHETRVEFRDSDLRACCADLVGEGEERGCKMVFRAGAGSFEFDDLRV